jgi:hypothetical protein
MEKRPMSLRVMTEETKKALAGRLPFAPGAFVETTLDCFRDLPEDAQPKFWIKDFTSPQYYAMRAAMRGDGLNEALITKTLQEGALVKWDNLPDSSFQEIVFSVEAIANLPFLWKEKLYWMSANLCSPDKLEREVLG